MVYPLLENFPVAKYQLLPYLDTKPKNLIYDRMDSHYVFALLNVFVNHHDLFYH